MKKFGQTFILLIAAATIFFTGAGVTIMKHCSISCSSQTFFITEQHNCCTQTTRTEKVAGSCCSFHKGIQQEACNDMTYTQDVHCKASRLSIDIDASSFRPQVSIPFVWISDASFTILPGILPDKVEYTDEYTRFESPPEIPPREYLSLIRILII